MTRVILASGISTNKHFTERNGATADPASVTRGGLVAVGCPVLGKLGLLVRALGPYTHGDEDVRQAAIETGVEWGMLRVAGAGAVNAVLAGPQILRVIPQLQWIPSVDEGRLISESHVAAIAVGPSLGREATRFLIEISAAQSIPCFLTPTCPRDMDLIELGAEVYVQVRFTDFASGALGPKELTRELLAGTGAAGVVVLHTGGAFGILRRNRLVLQAQAPLSGGPLAAVDGEVAFLAGFMAAFVNVPSRMRLDRALALGRLTAARHVSGMSAGTWSQLCAFQDHLCLPRVALAA